MTAVVQQNAPMGGLKRTGEVPGVWHPTNLRVKRSMLGGRRIIGGPSTPVPRWKLYENPFYDGIAAAAAAAAQQQSANAGGRNVAVSARKLAATLWELQELPISLTTSKSQVCPCTHYRSSPRANGNATSITKKSRDHLLALADGGGEGIGSQLKQSAGETPRLSSFSLADDHPCTDLDKSSMVSLQQSVKGGAWDGSKKNSVSNSRQVAAMRSHVHRLLERKADSRLAQVSSASASPASAMVLNRIRGLEDHQQIPQSEQMLQQEKVQSQPGQLSPHQQKANATPSSVVTALRMEVERARSKVHELELAQKSSRREIDSLLKRMSEEKNLWRNKEQEKVRAAVQTVKLEVEEEKKVRRRVESVNRKMSRELVEANLAVAKAVNELERERKARELMEDVCDELAREIGEDKAEVEELKRESAKVREEVEEERKMLQMAEVWREERVQMKLSEARLEVEARCAALDQLKADLDSFLYRAKNSCQCQSADSGTNILEAEQMKMQVETLNIKEMLKSQCLYSEAARDSTSPRVYEIDPPEIDNAGDERSGWSWNTVPNKRWEATKLQGHAGELGHKLESREQVLERLRRKYADQSTHLQHLHPMNGHNDRQWEAYSSDPLENERDGGSDWNSHESETGGPHGDDVRLEEDASQWESASEQDMETVQSNSVHRSRISSRGQGGADDLTRRNTVLSEASADLRGAYEFISPTQSSSQSVNNINLTQNHQLHQHPRGAAGAELPSADEMWKVPGSSPGSRGSKKFSEDRSRGEGSSRGSRNGHTRMASEQGSASPAREWKRSPDRGNPHIARGIKGFIEWPKMSRDNAVKGKTSDSKVEKADRRVGLRQNS